MPTNILIVEDEESILELIAINLKQSGFNPIRAISAEFAEKIVNEALPDLIILDWMLPGMNGIEFAKRLKTNSETKIIPIIMLTAKSEEDNKLLGLNVGADDYMTKPFSPKELMLIIKNLIENRLLIQRRFGHDLVNKQKEIEVPVVVPHNQKDDFVKAIKVYINENIEDYQLNGESIAKHFSISRMQLHRKLKALTNSSISVFIRNQRLKNAIELMDKTKMNISEIAYETGFSSPAHFSKTFKKEMGKTPSKYLEDKKQA